jgi:hypothetical protein
MEVKVRAFPEEAESEDSYRTANMIQASCWKVASMDGEAAFGGLRRRVVAAIEDGATIPETAE